MVEEVDGAWVGIVVVVEVVGVVVDMGREEGRDRVEVGEVDEDVGMAITLLALEGDDIEGADDVVKTTEEEDTDGRR